VTKERAFRKGDVPSPRHFPKGIHNGRRLAAHASTAGCPSHLAGWTRTRMPGSRPGIASSVRGTRLFLQLPLEDLDFLGESHIVADQTFDLAHGMQHRGVVAATEAPADLGQ